MEVAAMHSLEEHLRPDREKFAADPFGYSNLAWMRWAIAQNLNGADIDPERPPTKSDLKSPVLWLLQAHALSEAASIVLRSQPGLGHIPEPVKGVCDSQYCAAGLMLVSYSLESCLKAMLIMKHGIEVYSEEEKKYRTHRLDELAKFIPDQSSQDLDILRILSYYAYWAGRYPDAGSGREGEIESIFSVSQNHQVTVAELMRLASRVMAYAQRFTGAP